MDAPLTGWEKSLLAAERVCERAIRVAAVLRNARIPYAIAGDIAVGEWVGRVGEGAIRNSKDVEVILRRADFAAAKAAMEPAGFVYTQLTGLDMFLNGPNAKRSEAVHILFAREKLRPGHSSLTPDVDVSEDTKKFIVVTLEALIGMKLNSNRNKDRMHVTDLIQIGLIDQTWPARYPPLLAERLQHLLDTPAE